jgi:hypothetical protein
MRTIHIANINKRDAQVAFNALSKKQLTKKILPNGEDPKNVKFLKGTADINNLIKEYDDLMDLGNAIMEDDPEVDIELVGKLISKTRKLFVSEDNKIAYRVNLVQVIHNADDSEKERKSLFKSFSNVNVETPIMWSGKRFPKDEALHKFVFSKKYQIEHNSGLTYDFLYEMAKDLDETNTLMFVGGGNSGNDPIILTAGGNPYRGFLEGRIEGDKYCLILHLSNMELKPVTINED